MLLSEQVKSLTPALSKQLSIRKVYCWSDSLIALWLIKQNHKTWKLWIQNRVRKIRENVDIEDWSYVTSENNPVDAATRRTLLSFLVKKLLWWNGPSFLKGDEDSWLKANCTKDGVLVYFSSNDKAKQCLAGADVLVECCDSEKVVCLLMTDLKGKVFCVGEVVDVVRFDGLEKLLRVTAYVCRFVAKQKLQKTGDELIVGQLRVAEICGVEKIWISYKQSIISKEEEKVDVIIELILRQ